MKKEAFARLVHKINRTESFVKWNDLTEEQRKEKCRQADRILRVVFMPCPDCKHFIPVKDAYPYCNMKNQKLETFAHYFCDMFEFQEAEH